MHRQGFFFQAFVYLAAAVFNLAYTLLSSDSAGSLTAVPMVCGSCSSRAS